MENNPLFKKEESAGLRCQLETCLANIFIGDKIDGYLVATYNQTGLQFLSVIVDEEVALPQIKLAYAIWLGMHAADRHAVLAKFQQLYASLAAGSIKRQTLTFCVIFIYEFTYILAEATEWPD